jgi:hypothetical protein
MSSAPAFIRLPEMVVSAANYNPNFQSVHPTLSDVAVLAILGDRPYLEKFYRDSEALGIKWAFVCLAIHLCVRVCMRGSPTPPSACLQRFNRLPIYA